MLRAMVGQSLAMFTSAIIALEDEKEQLVEGPHRAFEKLSRDKAIIQLTSRLPEAPGS